jgi:hypothetical protein
MIAAACMGTPILGNNCAIRNVDRPPFLGTVVLQGTPIDPAALFYQKPRVSCFNRITLGAGHGSLNCDCGVVNGVVEGVETGS